MIPILFPDQQRSIEKLRHELRYNKSVLLQGETGSGKSVMAAYMIASSRAKGLKSAFVVPRRDLLHQMSRTFNKFDISHSFVADKKPFNPFSNTHICTIGSLVGKPQCIQPNIIFFDETHFGAVQLDKLINHYKSISAYVIGLSATPEKPNGRGLGEYYSSMVTGPAVRELIDLKRLSDYRLFAPSKPDLSRIKTVNGDYAKGELASFMEHESVLIGDAVKHYQAHAAGRLNITFCTSIKHSEMTAQAFRDAGIPSMHMDGETPDDDRRRIAQAFARREIMNICSVDLLTFGYDLASASGDDTAVIESISDLRPTKSLPLQRQKNGRAMRYKEQPAVILDHSGNAMYHGMPCEEIQWSLEGKKKNSREAGESVTPVRSCPNCFCVHRPLSHCPLCGYEYEVNGREVDQIDGELEELDPKEIARKQRQEQGMCKSLSELIAFGRKRGMNNPEGWARRVWQARDRKPSISVSMHAGNKEIQF